MATDGNAKKKIGAWTRFMRWYDSYSGKKVVGVVYSVGAAVVIIGALFKILHWPGASVVLMVGMFTEAFLFMIGVLDKPHTEYHWDNVFPQLLGQEVEQGHIKENQATTTLSEQGNTVQTKQQGAGHAVAYSSALSDKEMDALRNGITDLAKTAAQLSELGKVATSTAQLEENLHTVGQAAATLTTSFASAAQTLDKNTDQLEHAYQSINGEMEKTVEGTKAYQQAVDQMGNKLASLNAIYQLQLNAVQAQVDTYRAQTVKLATMSTNIEAVQEMTQEAQQTYKAYKEASVQLAKHVNDLNQIYGNMLNALA